MQFSPPSAVLLDFDDFLVDSETFYSEVYEKVTLPGLAKLGIHPIADDASYGTKGKLNIHQFMERIFGEENRDIAVHIHMKNKMNPDVYPHFKPGAEAFLSYLNELNIPHAIVSDSPVALLEKNVEKVFAGAGLPIPATIGHSAEIPVKPNPTGIIKALKLLNVPISEKVLMFGDMPEKDGDAARKAGITGIIVPQKKSGDVSGYNVFNNLGIVLEELKFSRLSNPSWLTRILEEGSSLYSKEKFAQKTVYITPQTITDELIPMMKNAGREVVKARMKAAQDRAKKCFAFYGFENPEEVGLAEEITEIICDKNFQRIALEDNAKLKLRDKIQASITLQEPILLSMPCFSHKMPSPPKSRGDLPCLSEGGALMIPGELSAIINHMYHEKYPEIPKEQQMGKFLLVGDSSRFRESNKMSEESASRYKEGLKWWIEKFNLQDNIELCDFEELMDAKLTEKQKNMRSEIYDDTLKKYQECFANLLDTSDVIASLARADSVNPFREELNQSFLFSDTFKSRLSCIDYDILHQLENSIIAQNKDISLFYQDVMVNIFEPYTQLDCIKSEIIGTWIKRDKNFSSGAPEFSDAEWMEYVRQALLGEAWNSTMSYLSRIRADEIALGNEAVALVLPETIRCTNLGKKHLPTISLNRGHESEVLPWHGVGVFRISHNNKIKLDPAPAAIAEGNGDRPMLLRGETDDPYLKDLRDTGQPIGYLGSELSLERIMQGRGKTPALSHRR